MHLNKTGKEASSIRKSFLKRTMKSNEELYEEYKNSKFQYVMTFNDFKKNVRKREAKAKKNST